jgi:hypothetical protein
MYGKNFKTIDAVYWTFSGTVGSGESVGTVGVGGSDGTVGSGKTIGSDGTVPGSVVGIGGSVTGGLVTAPGSILFGITGTVVLPFCTLLTGFLSPRALPTITI